MDKSTIAEILEKIRGDEEAQKFLKENGPAETLEETAELWSSAAAGMGYEIDAKEIREYMNDAESSLKQKAKENGEMIEALSDEELEQVAGGGDHPDCKSSFKDRENCWFNDACDVINKKYSDYKCHYNLKDVACGKYQSCYEDAVYI